MADLKNEESDMGHMKRGPLDIALIGLGLQWYSYISHWTDHRKNTNVSVGWHSKIIHHLRTLTTTGKF
jgi:hypothetical protein